MKAAVTCVVLVAALVAPSMACSDKVDSFVSGIYQVELGRIGKKVLLLLLLFPI